MKLSSQWVLLLIIIWLVGCGGSPQASLQQPMTPAPVVTPPPTPPSTPPPPSIPTSWTVTDLVPLPGFNASQANAVNSAGVVVGYSETPAGVTEATTWVNSMTIDLGPGIATAVNDSGQVVGYSQNTDLTFTAHLWQSSTTIDIGSWLPLGINNLGLIVGEDVNGINALQRSTTDSNPVSVPGCKAALGANDSDQISGIASNGNAAICGMPDYGVLGAAVAINITGMVVGYQDLGNGAANAILWPNTILAQQGLATGINDLGWVIGETFTSGGTNARTAVLGPGQEAGENWTGHWWNTRIAHRGRPDHTRLDAIAALAGQSHPWIWSQDTGLVSLPDPLITAEGISGSMVVGAGLASDGTIHGMLLEGK